MPWNFFVQGFGLFMTIHNLLLVLAGVALGIIMGATPGLTATLAVAVVLPFTLFLNAVSGIALLIGVYKGATYGGSVSAILIGTPGTPSAAATVLDGYELSKQGKPGKALGMAIYASVIGDTFSDIVLILVAYPLAMVALRFGPPELTVILVFSLLIIGLVSSGALLKGVVAGLFGLVLSLIGMDPMTGVLRFTFGNPQLFAGISFLPMLIGMYGISEVLIQAEHRHASDSLQIRNYQDTSKKSRDDNRVTRKDMKSSLQAIIMSSFIGTGIGILPGLGGAVAAFLGYGVAKNFSKKPEAFGKGSIEGVAAAEAANNAVCGATLVPLLAFGIPGDTVTAVLLGAFIIQGLTPGPRIFQRSGAIIYAIYISMLVANAANLFLGSQVAHYFSRLREIPKRYIFPVVVGFCVVGSYAVNSNPVDVVVMLVAGLLGYVLRKGGFPLAPVNIALILGPKLELSLRQSLLLSNGDWWTFFKRPLSLGLIIAFTIGGIGLVSVMYSIKRSRRLGAVQEGPSELD